MSDNSCCTEMVESVTASFQKQHLYDKESGRSDNSYTEMENPKEGSGSDNLSTEMDNPMDEMESGSEFVGRTTKVLHFKKERLCKDDDEDLKVVWDKEVKEVLAHYGLECELKWDEEKMSVTGTRFTPELDNAWNALYVIASGVTARIVEPIMSGELHCSVVRGLRANVSKEKYDTFVHQFQEHNIADSLSCYVIFQEGTIVILAEKEGLITVVTMLLVDGLFGDVPFHEAVEGALSLLRDNESTT